MRFRFIVVESWILLGCGMRQILRLIVSIYWSNDDKNDILHLIN